MAGAEHEDHESPALGPVATPGGTLPGNPQIQLVKVADGLADPINVAAPADDSGRLFVVERPGRIRIVDLPITISLAPRSREPLLPPP
jgi:hypothetical protein